MSAIEVSYQPTLRDVLHAARITEGESWKTTSRVVAVVLTACAVGCLYVGWIGWAALFFGLAVAEWFNLLPLSVVAAYFEFRRNPTYRQRYHLVLSPEALSFRTETVSSVLQWSHYTRCWETARAFVLSYGVGVPTVIPKAAFASDAERESVRTLLARVIGARHT